MGRKVGHRRALLSNMASSLIKHKRITTTQAKAKALRTYVEPLITKSKDDTTHSRRVVFSYLQDKDAVTELFREVSPKVMDRPGGYTRILKLENRPGDNAEMAMIELVDFNENLLSDKKEKKEASSDSAGKRRRRGSRKKSGSTAPVAQEEAKAKELLEDSEDISEAKVVEEAENVSTEETEEQTVSPQATDSAAGAVEDDAAKTENPVTEEKNQEEDSESDKSKENKE